MMLNFDELADGLRRNNVGLEFIEIEVTASIEGGRVVIQPTGQRFRLSGDPPKEAAALRRAFKVVDPKPGEETILQVLR